MEKVPEVSIPSNENDDSIHEAEEVRNKNVKITSTIYTKLLLGQNRL